MKDTIEKLLHQEFDIKKKGYEQDQVDDFLDEIIEDIERLEKKYKLLLNEKKILEKNNFELKMKMLDMKSKLEEQDKTKVEATLKGAYIPEPAVAPQPTVAPQPVVAPQPTVAPQPVVTPQPTVAPEPTVVTQPQSTPKTLETPSLGQAVTHEDSKANDFTLQQRIEQLEREINNIKSFDE